MADLDLWTENSTLSNFADDTQSTIVRENRKKLLETASREANCVINFFRSNGLVNNADKAAVLYSGKGKSISENSKVPKVIRPSPNTLGRI